MHLDCIEGDPRGGLTGVGEGRRGARAERLSFSTLRSARFSNPRVVSKAMYMFASFSLDELELADRLAELVALARVTCCTERSRHSPMIPTGIAASTARSTFSPLIITATPSCSRPRI